MFVPGRVTWGSSGTIKRGSENSGVSFGTLAWTSTFLMAFLNPLPGVQALPALPLPKAENNLLHQSEDREGVVRRRPMTPSH